MNTPATARNATAFSRERSVAESKSLYINRFYLIIKFIMNWLFNPFKRIAGWKALAIGICFLSLIAILGKVNNLFLGGIFCVSIFFSQTFIESFLTQIISVGVLTLVMWIAGIIFSKSKIRIIDVAGTMALSRAPLLFVVLLGFLPFFPKNTVEIVQMIIFGLICLILTIWMIVLMYNAYSVSCNLSGIRGKVSFTGALVIVESLLIIIFLSLSGYFPFASEEKRSHQIETILPHEQTINQTAEIVIDALKKSDIKTVRACFDETMKEGLSEINLRMVWAATTQQYGELKDTDTNVTAQSHENYSILLIPCTFEKGKLNLQLTFNSEGKIAGLFFR